ALFHVVRFEEDRYEKDGCAIRYGYRLYTSGWHLSSTRQRAEGRRRAGLFWDQLYVLHADRSDSRLRRLRHVLEKELASLPRLSDTRSRERIFGPGVRVPQVRHPRDPFLPLQKRLHRLQDLVHYKAIAFRGWMDPVGLIQFARPCYPLKEKRNQL